ncbi:hypothetical protein PAPYR_10820 [Paratrimastix pyriformis]|uniref:Uncharacterized protein n=1 Tax=Paratrimastix pyriformis TaxID=342808 RepID=A0ABQ8UAT3_9EUKA|nr:hypothetical protein PAPYR_10820 [Paratrimastix pyriformis]
MNKDLEKKCKYFDDILAIATRFDIILNDEDLTCEIQCDNRRLENECETQFTKLNEIADQLQQMKKKGNEELIEKYTKLRMEAIEKLMRDIRKFIYNEMKEQVECFDKAQLFDSSDYGEILDALFKSLEYCGRLYKKSLNYKTNKKNGRYMLPMRIKKIIDDVNHKNEKDAENNDEEESENETD